MIYLLRRKLAKDIYHHYFAKSKFNLFLTLYFADVSSGLEENALTSGSNECTRVYTIKENILKNQ